MWGIVLLWLSHSSPDASLRHFRSDQLDHDFAMRDLVSSTHVAGLRLLQLLRHHSLTVVTAESLTGGLIVKTLVDLPTFGGNVYGGFIVYNTDAKREFIDVQVPNVYNHKAAEQMARGALVRSRAMMAIAVTGQAGPTLAGDEDAIGVVDAAVFLRTGAGTRSYGETIRFNISRLLYTVQGEDYCEAGNHHLLEQLQRRECAPLENASWPFRYLHGAGTRLCYERAHSRGGATLSRPR
jgi:nicotinamide-nucleotide amidase